MNRRAFLRFGLVSSGALVVGCALGPAGTVVSRQQHRTGIFQPNAWIRITPDDRVIFTLDRVEMGQGTMTSQAMLVAEELEVELARLEIEPAEASRAYDNPDRQIKIQITGGSTSTKSAWQPLREAGAVAREMLRAGAADRWGVPLASCVASAGAIHHAASGRALRYGELVTDAARQAIPRVELKPPSAWRLIGTSVDRLDARPKVDGTGIYGMDVQLPGMLTAVIVRPPVRGARLRRFDASRAQAHAVVAVDAGVAVVARGYWEARKAAAHVEIEWDEGHGATIDSSELFAAYGKLLAVPGAKVVRDDGHAEHALAAPGGTLVEADYALPYLAHATMEPQNATCWIRDGHCEVWAPTQAPGIARWRVADAIGVDLESVSIHTTMLGGGFGRRGLVDYCVEAAQVARAIARPVKVVWSREDDQENDWYRPMQRSRLRGAIDARGAITAWHHRLVTQSILDDEGGDFVGALLPNAAPRPLRRIAAKVAPRLFARGTMPDSTSIEGAVELPYAIPNVRMELTPVETGVPVGFWRSVGHSHNAFVTEGFLDELLHAAGKDAYLGRRELLADHPRERAALDLAAAKADWHTPPAAGIGRGIAVHLSFYTRCAMVIDASVEGARVRVHRVVVAIDCGRVVNPQLVVAQAESAVIYGLSAALKQQITFVRGRVQETNFHAYKALRMFESPVIETHLVTSDAEPTGVGEPGVPPVAPALCAAIFAATGKRIRTLPIEAALARSA